MSSNLFQSFKANLALAIVSLVIINPIILPAATILADEIPSSYAVEAPVATEENINIAVDVQQPIAEVVETPSSTFETEIITEGSLFKVNGLKINETYSYSINNKVSITFTNLPEGNHYLTIEEIDTLQGEDTIVGYEFISDMTDGTFEYNLTLPNPYGTEAKVIYSEDRDGQTNNIDAITQNDMITLTSNHFTVFYVVNPNLIGNGNQSNDNCTTVTIAGSVTCYNTIQSAINASSNGDTVNIAPGIYNEYVIVNKSITLSGSGKLDNPATNTIIQPTGPAPISSFSSGIEIRVSNVTVQHIRVQNAPNGSAGNWGSGITVTSSVNLANIKLDELYVINNTGNGISFVMTNNATMTNLDITDSTISNNAGRGIKLHTNGMYSITDLFINSNVIQNNAIAGIYLAHNVIDSNITNNFIRFNNTCGIIIDPASGVNPYRLSNLNVNFNEIYGNLYGGVGSCGILNVPVLPRVNALNNYWGNVTGPADTNGADNSLPTTNPGGLGNKVYGAVHYEQWIGIGVANFSLEEGNESITVRWPETVNAISYKIYIANSSAAVSSATPITVIGCPVTGVNAINMCEYKIVGLTNTQTKFVDMKATYTSHGDSVFSGKIKYATPFSIVIDDDAQFAQEGINVGIFTPYNYKSYSSLRGTATYKSNDLYNAVGEDSYIADNTISNEKGIWQTGNNLTGYYDVYVNYLTYTTNSSNVSYVVGASGHTPTPAYGSTLSRVVNQQLDNTLAMGSNATEAGWVKIGTYYFDNILGIVTATSSDSAIVQMDAVAFQSTVPPAIVRVHKVLYDADGSTELDSQDTFNVNLIETTGSTTVATGTISDNGNIFQFYTAPGNTSLTAEFLVTPGNHRVEEDIKIGFVNISCSTIQNNLPVYNFTTTANVITDVICINMIDVTPTVTINPSPSANVTTPTTITVTATGVGGNISLAYSWVCNTGETSNTNIVNLSTVGVHNCTVTVTDYDGDTATANGIFTINNAVVPPVTPADLVPQVVLFGNSPTVNVGGIILGASGTNFTVTASLSTLGNATYNYAFGGVCSGSASNTSATFINSNILNLTSGNHVCTVTVTDTDGDIANASVTIIMDGGFGGPGPDVAGVSTSTDNDNGETDEEGSIQGVETQTCTTKSSISGFVFTDTNTNNRKDNAEKGLENVDLTIFTFDKDNKEIEVVKVKTNRIGYWETDLCAGTYSIRLDTNDLAENTVLGGSDTFSFTVNNAQDKSDVNFAAYNTTTSSGFNWWILILLLLIILLAGGGYAAYTTSKKNNA